MIFHSREDPSIFADSMDGLVARGLESRKDLVAREDRTVGESPRHVTRIGIGRPVEFERDGWSTAAVSEEMK